MCCLRRGPAWWALWLLPVLWLFHFLFNTATVHNLIIAIITAVGTGINTPPGFAARVIGRLATELDLPLSEAVRITETVARGDLQLATVEFGTALELATAAPTIALSVTGHRSTYQAPAASTPSRSKA